MQAFSHRRIDRDRSNPELCLESRATFAPEPSASEHPSPAPTKFRLAYLTTEYPSVSHTFIRREINALEDRGYRIFRLAIRPATMPLVDLRDIQEYEQTLHCNSRLLPTFLWAPLLSICTRPWKFICGLRLTLSMAARSDRGYVRHLAYFAQACYFRRKLHFERIDHLHVHFGTNAAAVARLIHRMGGPTYSMTVHGCGEFDAPRALDLKGKISNALFVVAVSSFTSAQLKRWAAPSDWSKINVIRCSLPSSYFQKVVRLDPRSRSFVCVARLSPEKGHLLLLEAFKTLLDEGNEAELTIIGDGELRQAIEERIQLWGIEHAVRLTGAVAGDVVRAEILRSRALVVPSFTEGLPIVILEALALGRVVISSCIGGIPELVRDRENGFLVPAGSVPQLAEAMKLVLQEDPARLDKMGQAGREAVRQQHYDDHEIIQLENLFRSHIRYEQAALDQPDCGLLPSTQCAAPVLSARQLDPSVLPEVTVIVPARNEEDVLPRFFESLMAQDYRGKLRIVVAANGCTDNTVEVATGWVASARTRGWDLQVLSLTIGSKHLALNAADHLAGDGPRVYIDADTTLSPQAISDLANNMGLRPQLFTLSRRFAPARSWISRAYTSIWKCLPAVTDGTIGGGFYAVNVRGRCRWGNFPDVIADDEFVSLQFAPAEIMHLKASELIVHPPEGFRELIQVRSRWSRGSRELGKRFRHSARALRRPKGRLFAHVVWRPSLWIPMAVFVAVCLGAEVVAFANRRAGAERWERSDKSRVVEEDRKGQSNE